MNYNINKINFQTYSWVYGTTSFRVSELKYKIEKQLFLIEDLRSMYPNTDWKEIQEDYFDLLEEAELSKSTAKDMKKDARQKTSSLKDLGLVTSDRKITPIGKVIQLSTIERDNIKFNNIFSLRDDNYLYFKQFLKIEFSKNSDSSYNSFAINPFLALIYSIVKLGSISNDFFNILLPIQKNFEEVKELVDTYSQNTNINQLLLNKINSMENYQNALNYFIEKPKNETTFKTVFLNMKGGKFDLPYKGLYDILNSYSVNEDNEIKLTKLKECVNYISQKLPNSLLKNPYYKILFNRDKKPIKNDYNEDMINQFETSFLYTYTDIFDKNFFYLVHLVKWLTNLEKEYADNNKRFLSLTDVIIFDENNITLNPIIKVYFEDIIDDLIADYSVVEKSDYTDKLHNNLNLNEINPILDKDLGVYAKQLQNIFPNLNLDLNIQEQIFKFSKDDKTNRFNSLINKYFDNKSLIELLEHITVRDDKKILDYKNIDWDTNIPTIFEYLIGIAWYSITNRQADITDFLNMSLDSNLLPLRFAGGGQSDIVCKYPRQDILIEVTLSNDENQRRMELEPVSRHLGRYLLKGNNAYAIFIAPYLDPNVLVGFRSYKNLNYYDKSNTSKFVNNLKIIPLSIQDIIYILKSNLGYEYLETFFNTIYQDEENDGYKWYTNKLNPKLREIQCS